MSATYTLQVNGNGYEVTDGNGNAISHPLPARKAADLLRRLENGAHWADLTWDGRTVDEILTENGITETAGHVCNEADERAAYNRYVSDGIAATDGWFLPESSEDWQTHHHREIGHREPRKKECTATACNAPQHERTRCLNLGTRRKPRHVSLCPSCYEPRAAVTVAAERARRAPLPRPVHAPQQLAFAA